MSHFNIAIPGQEYKEKITGRKKRKWNVVGAGFKNKDSSITCKIDNNISISGEFVLFEAKTKT
jgi:hypothetical protein